MLFLLLTEAYLDNSPAEIADIHGIGTEKAEQLMKIFMGMRYLQHDLRFVNNVMREYTVGIQLIAVSRQAFELVVCFKSFPQYMFSVFRFCHFLEHSYYLLVYAVCYFSVFSFPAVDRKVSRYE